MRPPRNPLKLSAFPESAFEMQHQDIAIALAPTDMLSQAESIRHQSVLAAVNLCVI